MRLIIVLLLLVLIPFFLWENDIAAISAHWVSAGASQPVIAAAVIGLLAADVVLPVPSSVVCVSAGALLGFPLGFLVNFTGLMVGCALGYGIGRVMEPWARARLLRDGDWHSLRDRLTTYADLSILLSRPVPVFAEAVVLASGVLKLPVARLLLMSALGNAAVAALYAAVGAFGISPGRFLAAFACSILVPWLGMRYFGGWMRRSKGSA